MSFTFKLGVKKCAKGTTCPLGSITYVLAVANLMGDVRSGERLQVAHTVRQELALCRNNRGRNVLQRPVALPEI
jgi:hypothetical protein